MTLARPHLRRVPDPRARGPRLPRHGRHVADRAAGDRGDGPLLRDLPRDRSTAASTRSPPRRRTPTRARARRSPRSPARPPARPSSPRNATEAINLVALRVGPRERRRRTTWCVITADGAPLQHRPVADCSGAGSRTCRSTTTGCSTSTRSTRCWRAAPKLVAVAHVSNVLGTINPIAEIVARAHAAGALVLVDGAQAVPSMPVDVAALGADFYAWTGHKAYGPTGHRRAARPPRAAGGDAAVPRRRAHDRPRRRLRVHLGRAARPSSRRARCRSPRRSGSAPPSTGCPGSAWTRCASTAATSRRTRSSGWPRCPG